MIHDAAVEVTCDGDACSESVYVDLPASARGGYIADDDAIEREIMRDGWGIVEDQHFCPTCCEEDSR